MTPWIRIASILVLVLPGGSLILLAFALVRLVRTLRERQAGDSKIDLAPPAPIALEKTA